MDHAIEIDICRKLKETHKEWDSTKPQFNVKLLDFLADSLHLAGNWKSWYVNILSFSLRMIRVELPSPPPPRPSPLPQ